MVDLVGLVILAIFVALGAIRGTLASALRIATLFLSYGAAFLGGPRFGPMVAERFSVPQVLGTGLAAAATFVAAYFVLGVLGSAINAIARQRRQNLALPRTGFDRFCGALLGGVYGGVMVLLLGLLVSYVSALSHGPLKLPELPGVDDSALVSLCQSLARKGAEAAFDDGGAGGRIAVELVAAPADTMERIEKVLQNPRIEDLSRDEAFWKYVMAGSVDVALNQPSFLGIAHDDTLRGELAALGVVSDAGRVDARLFRNSAKDALKEIAPRLKRIQNDPAFQELAQDPAVAKSLESGDTLALLSHPKFRALVSRALDEPS